jgi:hypothetical protein
MTIPIDPFYSRVMFGRAHLLHITVPMCLLLFCKCALVHWFVRVAALLHNRPITTEPAFYKLMWFREVWNDSSSWGRLPVTPGGPPPLWFLPVPPPVAGGGGPSRGSVRGVGQPAVSGHPSAVVQLRGGLVLWRGLLLRLHHPQHHRVRGLRRRYSGRPSWHTGPAPWWCHL